jgi:hypothetical protein
MIGIVACQPLLDCIAGLEVIEYSAITLVIVLDVLIDENRSRSKKRVAGV